MRRHDEDGATAVEYGILAGGIALAMVALGPWLAQVLIDLVDAITSTML